MNKFNVEKVKINDPETNSAKLVYTVTIHTDSETVPDDYFIENWNTSIEGGGHGDRIIALRGAFAWAANHPKFKNSVRLSSVISGLISQAEEALIELNK